MNDWWNGPILYLAPLNKSEEHILGDPNKLMAIKTESSISPNGKSSKVSFATAVGANATFNAGTWNCILSRTEKNQVSWIYLPDEEPQVITALNILLSRLEYNIRAKGRLMSEFTGRPVGVVY